MLSSCGVEDSWEFFGLHEIKPVNPKGNQPWIFTGGTDAEVEAPILWSSDAKNWLIRKDPDAGKDWRQEKGMTEYEMVGWHHWLNRHEFEQTPGDGEGQGRLAFCSPWGHKELDTTERLNWTELRIGKHSTLLIFLFFFLESQFSPLCMYLCEGKYMVRGAGHIYLS